MIYLKLTNSQGSEQILEFKNKKAMIEARGFFNQKLNVMIKQMTERQYDKYMESIGKSLL